MREATLGRKVPKALRPTRCVSRIEMIDLDELERQGIRCILFDRDNTVVPRDSREAPRAVLDWLASARAHGMRCLMVSNNSHRDRVARSAGELGVEGYPLALKPLPFSVRRACVACGVPPEQTVMIGDQLFTDILSGNLAGMETILVRPQCDTDLPGMGIMRKVERLVVGDAEFEGEDRR